MAISKLIAEYNAKGKIKEAGGVLKVSTVLLFVVGAFGTLVPILGAGLFSHMLGVDGGRLCIITFHSLEDRMVKTMFKKEESPCTCPPEFPVCVCGKKPRVKIKTKKPILPSEMEQEENSRARSAKLRVLERI